MVKGKNGTHQHDDKLRVMTLGLPKLEAKARRAIFSASLVDDDQAVQAIDDYVDLSRQYGDDFKVAGNLNKSNYKRSARLRTRIASMVLSGYAQFITLTFTDEVLATTSETTRRVYVARWCKTYGNDYVANIDFGPKTDREHYHAVMLSYQPKDALKWPYGFFSVRQCGSSDADLAKLSKYIAKLTYHAIKGTTRGIRIIYAKDPARIP